MRRYSVLLIGIMAFTAGCDEDPAPAPSGSLPPVFTATLTTAAEVPAPSAAEQSCSGTVRIQLNVTRANATSPITAATADFNATIAACPTTTVIRISHIHEAPVGVSGGIVVDPGIAQGDVVLTNGAGGFTKNGINVTDVNVAQRMIDNPAGFYFNIHSVANGPGVIRGQLTKIQ